MRLVVIGDVGGHLDELSVALTTLGVDTVKGAMPDNLIVCQVGDLIHRGPASVETLMFVDLLIRNNPGQWIQLAGNHEAQYLHSPVFAWPEVLPDAAADLLCSWWDTGKMLLAAFNIKGVVADSGVTDQTLAGELLVTHAGLSRGLHRLLGEPDSAALAAEKVNDLRFDPRSSVYRPGTMLGLPSAAAGVLWAEEGTEVLLPWATRGWMPFHQAHGHSSAFWWDGTGKSDALKNFERFSNATTKVDEKQRILGSTLGDKTIWGVDPGHGKRPAKSWSPLILQM